MRVLKIIGAALAALIIAVVVWLYASDNQHLLRAVRMTYLQGHTTANIYDESGHKTNPVNIGTPQPWQRHPAYNQMTLPAQLRQLSEQHGIKGLVVVKNQQLVYEEYWGEHQQDTRSNSFSMAKTVNVMLVGAAIADGFIQSMQQPITDFLPEYRQDPAAAKVTVEDLATMSSGYDWDEEYYSVINPTTKAYYGADIEQQMLARAFIAQNYGKFYYSSGSAQMLGVVLHRAIGKPLASYLSEKIWQPMGMEYPATWSLDANGTLEKTYCCLNATARDFAKLGQLLLNNGTSNQQQPILNPQFVAKMHTPNSRAFAAGEPVIYGYSTWLDYGYKPPFYALLGHLGQRVIVIPSENLIITRVGTQKDIGTWQNAALQDRDIYYLIDGVREMLAQKGI